MSARRLHLRGARRHDLLDDRGPRGLERRLPAVLVDERVLAPERQLVRVAVLQVAVVRLARGRGADEAGVELPRAVLEARDHREQVGLGLLHADEDAAGDVAAHAAGEGRGLGRGDLRRVHERRAPDDAAHVEGREQEAALRDGDLADRLLEQLERALVGLQVLHGLVGHDDGLATRGLELHGVLL